MDDPHGFPPLTQTTFYILASLMDGPKHGYGVIKDVERRSECTVDLGIGNLYKSLDGLVDRGLVARAGIQQVDHRKRKMYRITGVGEAVLHAETVRQERMARANPLLRPKFGGA